jgi:type III secretion protein O
VIKQLLRIKTFREKKAETEMLKSKVALAKAQADEAQAQRALREYIEQATLEERRLYAELCSRVVRLREITRVQEEVVCLKLGEQARQDALVLAEKAHLNALDVFQSSSNFYRTACSARQKFDELLRIETARVDKEFEQKEESELEELAGQLRDRPEHDEVEHAG